MSMIVSQRFEVQARKPPCVLFSSPLADPFMKELIGTYNIGKDSTLSSYNIPDGYTHPLAILEDFLKIGRP